MPKIEDKLQWRENLHKTLIALVYCDEGCLPQGIIDAIDAAYVAGLDYHKAKMEDVAKRVVEMIMDRETGDGYSEGYDEALSEVLKIIKNV